MENLEITDMYKIETKNPLQFMHLEITIKQINEYFLVIYTHVCMCF